MTSVSLALAALYLPTGVSKPWPRSVWRSVEGAIRRAGDWDAMPEALRERGHWAEALALEDPSNVDVAQEALDVGRILTAACAGYPSRWLHVLGAAAPPVLWKSGSATPASMVAVVGSRAPSPAAYRFCRSVAGEAVNLGHVVVSGGAVGCDTAARIAAGNALLEILPRWFSPEDWDRPGCRLTLCAPGEEFSAGRAMERNALIYAAAELAVVGEVRLRQGGSWHGAADALRRRLTRVFVKEADLPGHRALCALGASPLAGPKGLSEALAAAPLQAALFSGVG